MTIVVAILALLVASQYAFIGLYIVPRLARLADEPGPVIRAGQWGAALFFMGCALTHIGIAVHTLQTGGSAGHLLLVHVWPHLAQVLGGATFSYIAWKKLDVRFTTKGYDEERQRTERERLRAAAQVALDAQAEAERSNRAKSEFVSRMSHELRTPLNAVLGFGQLLQLNGLDARQADHVDQILKGGRHLLGLIDEVLNISRMESGKLTLSMEPVELSRVLGDVLSLVQPMAFQRGIQLSTELSDAPAFHVMADEQRLRQVLLNLLSNAIKYNRDGGRVTVSLRKVARERVHVVVSDTGQGIPPDKLDRVFTAFDRLGAENGDVEGTGLGLALSKRLAEAMDGALAVESTLGEGSSFSIELALAEPRELPRVSDEDGTGTEAVDLGPASILYIEDNVSNVVLVRQILELETGVGLSHATQGGLGIELAQRHRPDIVLLDLHLPDMPGADVLARLKGDPRTRHIPVVVMSADASPGRASACRDSGAHAYLTKPLDLKAFLATIEACLANRQEARGGREASPAAFGPA